MSDTGYRPGLHILSTFSAPPESLRDLDGCRQCFTQLIADLGLQQVGEAWHAFPEAGFTAVLALTESHLSIHTWPEWGLATFDVFLSSFRRDNSDAVRKIYAETLRHFGGAEISMTEVSR